MLAAIYDYDPRLFDAVVLETQFAGTRVIGTADQLWGLLDGVNDRGLAASLTFGGRRATGRGFSVPLVIRYVLETCATVGEGVAALRRLPVQAAYNVTLVDRDGDHATVWLAPGEPARVTGERVATNHQGEVDWAEHARWTRSVERHERLTAALDEGGGRRARSHARAAAAQRALRRRLRHALQRRLPPRRWRRRVPLARRVVAAVVRGVPRGDTRRGARLGMKQGSGFEGGRRDAAERRGMNRRAVLEEVAAGRLAPAAAARLLDAPAARAPTVRLRSAYQAVDVVADPLVVDVLVVGGTHRVQREGDVLVVSDAAGRLGSWQGGGRLALRANPALDLDVEVIGAVLSVCGMKGAVRASVQAGSARVERAAGAVDLRVTAGAAVVTGAPRAPTGACAARAARWSWYSTPTRTRRSPSRARHSHVDALGSPDRAVLGAGAHAIDVDAAYSDVRIRTP